MSKKLPRLYYSSDDRPKPLPEWAYFFVRLGYQLAARSSEDYRFVIGLAIPTRAFASGLAATGILLAKGGNEAYTDSAQLKYICSLKPGTHVHVRTDYNRKLRGVVLRFETRRRGQYIWIRTTDAEERCYPVERYASRITVAEKGVSLPKYQQSGYKLESPGEFLECCLGDELAEEHILDSSFEALIVGRKTAIRKEVCETKLICQTSDKSATAQGSLQDILRVRQFSGANKSYRTQCMSSSTTNPEDEVNEQIPPVVILDGAISYIKLGHMWWTAHQIVLLDRTERQFQDAVKLLNQNYARRLEGRFKFPIRIPSGIEMMVYRENSQ